jgi:hypothetical protein
MEISLSGKSREECLLRRSTSVNSLEAGQKLKPEEEKKDGKNKSKIEHIR